MNDITLEPLDKDVGIQVFDCGEPQINELINKAYYPHILHQINAYTIKVAGAIVGYVAISVVGVSLDMSDGDISDYCDGCSTFGAVKINFIGIDKRVQRKGIGTAVIKILIKRIMNYGKDLPIRILTLDAISTKIDWYKERGFKCLNQDSDKSSFTKAMYLDLMDEQHKQLIQKYCEQYI